jgi:hypothetical protein
MAMMAPLIETGKVLSLKHSNHILICRFIFVLINAAAKLQKDYRATGHDQIEKSPEMIFFDFFFDFV